MCASWTDSQYMFILCDFYYIIFVHPYHAMNRILIFLNPWPVDESLIFTFFTLYLDTTSIKELTCDLNPWMTSCLVWKNRILLEGGGNMSFYKDSSSSTQDLHFSEIDISNFIFKIVDFNVYNFEEKYSVI